MKIKLLITGAIIITMVIILVSICSYKVLPELNKVIINDSAVKSKTEVSIISDNAIATTNIIANIPANTTDVSGEIKILGEFPVFTSSYRVLSGEISVSIQGKVTFTIDKAKVMVVMRNRPVTIPVKISNKTEKDISILISQRIPDFVTPNYVVSMGNILRDVTVVVKPFSSYTEEITITPGNSFNTQAEAWISFKDYADKKEGISFSKELIMRVLIN